ncbi:MAG TPA: hypothetical protein VFC24_05515 [Casimicrobiaceae bacterium]|nr:hypothetical protein [Casimicrobiaceae bacterium]
MASVSAIETPVQPAVPAPAAATHPLRDAIVVVLFAIGIALPLAGVIAHRHSTITTFEKRTTASWPGLSDTRESPSFTKAFEAAFDDRFGGRDRLIHIHHWLLAVGLHVSPVPKVLIGRDDWLFFKGEDSRAIDRDFRGIVPYPPEQPVEIANELQRRRDFLAQRGIPYFVLIVPDKATIYPEQLPAWITRAPKTRLDRLFAALAAHPDLDVIDPRRALLARKSSAQVYYRTDSHWNYEGAIVAYDLLMPALRRALPRLPHVPAERPSYEPGDEYSGDLAQLIGLPRAFREPDWLPFRKILGDASHRCARPIHDPVEPVVEGCNREGLPRAVIYRDSMLDAMIPPISENFRRVVYFAGHHMRAEDLAREQPDVVVEEFVERTMHSLLVDPLP